MINQVILEGRVVKTPEIRHTKDGNPYVAFTLANNISYQQDGEWKETSHFIDCIIFNSVLLEKGDRIIVFGTLQQRQYEDKEGKRRDAVSVKVKAIRILAKGSKKEDEEVIDF